MIKIFSYYDYQKFLKDFYDDQKSENSFFSYRYMANRVELEHSSLIKILQGSRHLSLKKLPNFKKLCSFSEKEYLYFENLVYFGRAKSDKESALYFKKIQEIKGVEQYGLQNKQFEFFRHWYYTAIWSLLNFYDFRGDFKDLSLQLQPSVSVKKVKTAIEDMVELGLVELADDGAYKTVSQNIATGEKWHSVAVNEYLKKSLILASESMDTCKRAERDISAVIVDIPEEKMSEIKDLIYEFRKTIISKVNGYNRSDRVYQLSMQMFPLSKKVRDND